LRDDFEVFLALLDEKRGDNLRNVSMSISPRIYDILQKKDCAQMYMFESMESKQLKNALLDSPTIVGSCCLMIASPQVTDDG
jgi:hypothetical protein